MITVDGEAVPRDGDSGSPDDPRNLRIELKLCKALAMLSPPQQLHVPLAARIYDLQRSLRRSGVPDTDGRHPASLTDDELAEAAAIVRACAACPPGPRPPGTARASGRGRRPRRKAWKRLYASSSPVLSASR